MYLPKIDQIESEYKVDASLKRDDVKDLLMWVQSQPHLPRITENEAIWFLKSCYYSNEQAKITIDNFYTMRTHVREMFAASTREEVTNNCKITFMWHLSRKTTDGDSVLLIYLKDKDPSHFDLQENIKLFDSVVMMELLLRGTHNGLHLVLDIENSRIGLIARLGIMDIKKGLAYIQEALPVRLKGIHFINIKPFLETILAICKPFLQKEFYELIRFHETLEDFTKYVPLECMPKEYGGEEEPIKSLEDKMLSTLLENEDFFKYLDSQMVDESKRPGKPKKSSDLFGTVGTFKKLDLD